MSGALAGYDERFGRLDARLGDQPQWLAAMRRTAFARFSASGFPDPRHEEWKYTNVRPIAAKAFAAPDEVPAAVDAGQLAALGVQGMDGHLVVLVNGRLSPGHCLLDGLPEGAYVRGLAETLAAEPERLEGLLGSVASDRNSSFAALNTAMMEDGVVIDLAPDTVIERPLHLLLVAGAGEPPVAAHPRILIRAGRGAQLTVVEHYAGLPGAKGFTNAVTEVLAESGAVIEHYRLQEEAESGYHVGALFVRQRRDSRYISHNIALGARLARTDIDVELAEPGAEVTLNGLFLPRGRQHQDTHTRVHHAAPHTRSNEGYRGIADGHGRGVFKGRVWVDRGAQKIEAHQNSANLLLSEQAEIDTKPELEIYADDVVCSHGATVGQLDAQALYYLRSRGLDPQTARGILVFAFAGEVVERMGLDALRGRVEERLLGSLPDAEMLRGLL